MTHNQQVLRMLQSIEAPATECRTKIEYDLWVTAECDGRDDNTLAVQDEVSDTFWREKCLAHWEPAWIPTFLGGVKDLDTGKILRAAFNFPEPPEKTQRLHTRGYLNVDGNIISRMLSFPSGTCKRWRGPHVVGFAEQLVKEASDLTGEQRLDVAKTLDAWLELDPDDKPPGFNAPFVYLLCRDQWTAPETFTATFPTKEAEEPPKLEPVAPFRWEMLDKPFGVILKWGTPLGNEMAARGWSIEYVWERMLAPVKDFSNSPRSWSARYGDATWYADMEASRKVLANQDGSYPHMDDGDDPHKNAADGIFSLDNGS